MTVLHSVPGGMLEWARDIFIIRRYSPYTPSNTGITIGRSAVFGKRKCEMAYTFWIPAYAGMTEKKEEQNPSAAQSAGASFLPHPSSLRLVCSPY